MSHDAVDYETMSLAAEDAAQAACDILDETFPGADNGGITSNFQGLLAEHIRAMLQGEQSANCVHNGFGQVKLPTLYGRGAR